MAARSSATLRAVPPASAGPEAELAALFAWEAQLQRQLGQVADAIGQARADFARVNGLQMLPRTELLRERFAPKPEPHP